MPRSWNRTTKVAYVYHFRRIKRRKYHMYATFVVSNSESAIRMPLSSLHLPSPKREPPMRSSTFGSQRYSIALVTVGAPLPGLKFDPFSNETVISEKPNILTPLEFVKNHTCFNDFGVPPLTPYANRSSNTLIFLKFTELKNQRKRYTYCVVVPSDLDVKL